MTVYSESARRVLDAIEDISAREFSVRLFGTRLAKAVTEYEAGFVKEGPVGPFLIHTSQGASSDVLLSSISEAWLGGKTWDSISSFFKVDCTSSDHRALLSLMGGFLSMDQHGRQNGIRSRLLDITQPHFHIRAGDILRDIANWREWFVRNGLVEVQKEVLLSQVEYEKRMETFNDRLDREIHEEQSRHYKSLEAISPFLSVVVFSGINAYTYPGMLDVVQEIARNGSITTNWPKERVDFSNSIVIMTTRDVFEEKEKSRFGLEVSRGYGEKSEASATSGNGEWDKVASKRYYDKAQEYLSSIPQLSGIVESAGRHKFVLRSRTFSMQYDQVVFALHDMKRRLAEVGVIISWSDAFAEGLTGDTKDEGFGSYTEGRLRNSIEEHILYPLAGSILDGGLRQGSEVCFDAISQKGAFKGSCCVVSEGSGEPITPKGIKGVWVDKKIGADHFDEDLLEKNEVITRLYKKAIVIAQEVFVKK